MRGRDRGTGSRLQSLWDLISTSGADGDEVGAWWTMAHDIHCLLQNWESGQGTGRTCSSLGGKGCGAAELYILQTGQGEAYKTRSGPRMIRLGGSFVGHNPALWDNNNDAFCHRHRQCPLLRPIQPLSMRAARSPITPLPGAHHYCWTTRCKKHHSPSPCRAAWSLRTDLCPGQPELSSLKVTAGAGGEARGNSCLSNRAFPSVFHPLSLDRDQAFVPLPQTSTALWILDLLCPQLWVSCSAVPEQQPA